MNKNISVNRTISVDVLRGIAMLLVVMGHVMTGCTTETQNNLFYNIIWSLQMPMFYIISGYTTRFSRNINTAKELGTYIGKRSLSYLLPLIVWTFLIRGLIFNHTYFLNIKYIIFHMHRGYWYLFSLWTISVMYGVSQWLTNKICKDDDKHYDLKNSFFTTVFLGAGAVLLVVIAFVVGDIRLLCIKLTLYYLPFYLAGCLFGKMQNSIYSLKHGNRIIDLIVAVCATVFTIIVMKINLVTLSDSPTSIIIRTASSLIGCIAVIGLISKIVSNGKVSRCLAYVGLHSIELYLSHYLVLVAIKPEFTADCSSTLGLVIIVSIFLLTVLICLLFSHIASKNSYLNFILFAKYNKSEQKTKIK